MKIAVSILTSNFMDLTNEIKSVSNADYLHLDIMDGHFVPNMSFGPYISSLIGNVTEKPLDIHLMVTDPLFWIDQFNLPTAEYITIHCEAKGFKKAYQKIKDLNLKTGISLKPHTKVATIKDYLHDVDLILIMTVEPGFGGQSFDSEAAKKIRELAVLKKKYNYKYLIEVDGGINLDTLAIIKEYGADIAVIGSFLFKQKNRNQLITELQK